MTLSVESRDVSLSPQEMLVLINALAKYDCEDFEKFLADDLIHTFVGKFVTNESLIMIARITGMSQIEILTDFLKKCEKDYTVTVDDSAFKAVLAL